MRRLAPRPAMTLADANQPGLFDRRTGLNAKREGMARAADGQPALLDIAREIAVELALGDPHQETNADQVGIRMMNLGYPRSIGPAAGSIFRGSEWEFTGRRKLSSRITNHARELKIWRFVG